MPIYNGADFIEKAMKSILEQSFCDFELLMYNDASTDNSSEIIAQFNDPRIKLFNGESNWGSLKSRNFLFNEAKGEYFIFHDADDWSEPDRFKKLVSFMDNHPDCGMCGSNVNVYDEKNLCTLQIVKPQEDKEIKNLFQREVPIYFPSSIVRKSVYETIGGFREYFHDLGNYDYDWMYRISEKFKCSNIQEGLYNVTRRGLSNSTNIVNPYKVIGDKLVQYLGREREETGTDSLETGSDDLKKYADQAIKPYSNDKSLFTYDRIVGLMAERQYRPAFKLSLKAIIENPKKMRNYRTTFYVLRKWIRSKSR